MLSISTLAIKSSAFSLIPSVCLFLAYWFIASFTRNHAKPDQFVHKSEQPIAAYIITLSATMNLPCPQHTQRQNLSPHPKSGHAIINEALLSTDCMQGTELNARYQKYGKTYTRGNYALTEWHSFHL